MHGDILSKALNKENYLNAIIYVNYVFMAIVVIMLQPVIYIDNVTRVLGEMYFRVLGAMGIIDGTLSILTIIFYKLYMHKHPKSENLLESGFEGQSVQKVKKSWSIWVWILMVYLFIQIVVPLVFLTFFWTNKFF